jgi:hypothetical protein
LWFGLLHLLRVLFGHAWDIYLPCWHFPWCCLLLCHVNGLTSSSPVFETIQREIYWHPLYTNLKYKWHLYQTMDSISMPSHFSIKWWC